MLAQNFKTALELGIDEKEVDALRMFLGMAERGELVDAVSNGYTFREFLNKRLVRGSTTTKLETLPSELWAGLLTEAGELAWPDYSRKQGRRVGNEYIFAFGSIKGHIAPGTILWAGLFDSKSGGHILSTSPILHQDHPPIVRDDTITLVWEIRFK